MTNEEALKKFLLDIDCLNELLPWTGKFNLFDVLRISRTEIRHSNMLAWLLNANENHGMGDAYVKALVQKLVANDSAGSKFDRCDRNRRRSGIIYRTSDWFGNGKRTWTGIK